MILVQHFREKCKNLKNRLKSEIKISACVNFGLKYFRRVSTNSNYSWKNSVEKNTSFNSGGTFALDFGTDFSRNRKTQKAAIISSPGPQGQVSIQNNIPILEPGDGEVLVKIEYSGVW